ncbi:MAG: PEP-CTERM sorting domain-containing protein [Coleofasciculus sp. G1-WW12-02]|uniref:PEP-CTERM sorting domain-containing protein n=1 Tax=Coleofasciculus sp. G1-WW12-02 TaxID=3068483 RepID=UPI0032F92D12
MKNYQKLAIVTAGLALSFAAIEANSAQAAIITYDFTVDVTTGLLTDTQYQGFFSYDDSTLTGSGVESVGIAEGLSISFDFLGVTYTEADDNLVDFGFPFVEFNQGSLVGLQYTVSNGAIFSIFGDNPTGLGGGDEFNYIDETSFEVGNGNVTYSLRPPSASVPEPSAVLGLGILGFGWLVRTKFRVHR